MLLIFSFYLQQNVPKLPPIRQGPYGRLREKRQSSSGPTVTSLGDEPGTSGAGPKLPPVVRIMDDEGHRTRSEPDAHNIHLFDESLGVENPANFEYENPDFVAKEADLDSRRSV